MNQNILQILDINTWTYQIKKYLTIGNAIFKYYYQSKKLTEKSLLLIDSKSSIINELVFYFKNYSNWDVALLDSKANLNEIKFASALLQSSDYKKIIIIGNELKQNLNSYLNNKAQITFLDNIVSKRELWGYIQ